MQNLKESLETEFRIPNIDGDRCVHAHIEQASCKACVTACPKDAWILNDESLGLNTTTCDGCGLCVPACTEGAITQTQDCTIREEEQKKVLLLGCELSWLDEANCKCIHAVGTSDLLKLYRDGVHQIKVTTGECNQCSRGKSEHLYDRVKQINKMLRQRRSPPLHYNELSATDWQQLWKTPEKAAPGVDMNRRMFFRTALTQTVDMVLHQTTFDSFGSSSGEFTPPGKILPIVDNPPDKKTQNKEAPSSPHSYVYPAIPQINATKCTACHTCINACPHDVLQFHPQHKESQANYAIEASACTGCNICVDICGQEAIRVTQWHTSKVATVPLTSKSCHSCGVMFHFPTQDQAIESTLCNICSQIDHQKNLFQVYS